MNLTSYLKAEFSMTGPLLRELMSFFSGEKEQIAFRGIHRHLFCPVCRAKASPRTDGELFYVACDADPAHTKRLSGNSSAELAALDWLLQKEIVTPIRWGNPWIDPDRWKSRLAKTDVRTMDGRLYFFQLIAEIKMHHHLWVAHKRSSDYTKLSREEQLLVESIGLLSKLFKQEVMAVLQQCSGFGSLSACQAVLEGIEADIAKKRLSVWKQYINGLSDDFKTASFMALRRLAQQA